MKVGVIAASAFSSYTVLAPSVTDSASAFRAISLLLAGILSAYAMVLPFANHFSEVAAKVRPHSAIFLSSADEDLEAKHCPSRVRIAGSMLLHLVGAVIGGLLTGITAAYFGLPQ